MKRLLSLILCVAVLVSTTVTAQAKEGEDEAYHTINVEFSDSDGAIETLQVMVKNDNVYANAEELGERLGYQVNISEEYVSICNKDENETVPYGLTVFYFNSTQISHMLFNKMVDYEAPFEIVKNEEGAWIPLEQSLLLLNSSMLIVDNVLIIDMPEKNIIDIYMDILKNNSTLLFDWNSDFGYTDWDWKVIGSASHVVNMFNGLLKKDGDTWVQFVQMFAMNTSSYDSKYGEAIAELFCTYSDEELSQEVQKMKKVMGYFDTSGTLGRTLKTLEKSVPSDADIKTLQETCNQLREKIDGSSTSIAAYNRAYQALENATDEATLFSDSLAGSVLEIEKNVSSVTGFMDKVFKIAEIVGYAKEFQNQDKFAVEALDEYISNSDSQSLMSKAMKSGISDYINILKTDIVSYSALKYLNENYDSLIMEATDLSSALGTQANLELIAWDLIQSANILNIGDKIKAADEFELALYSSVFQGDAFVSYQSIRDSVFSDVSNVTPENLYSVSKYCYTYLKSCYITRNAAVASLKGKTKDVQEQIQPLIDYENGINETIAKYLVCLKDADRTNEKLCYGFLLEDNEEYLKNCSNENIIKLIQESSVSYEDAYNEILNKYKEACSVDESEWANNLDFYNTKYKDLNTDILNEYHIAEHYDDITEGDIPILLGYRYYDIDGNGVPELLLAWYGSEIVCFDIFAFDGDRAIKLFADNDWYTSYCFFTNGIIEKISDDIEYYRFSASGYEIESVKDVNHDELLKYQLGDTGDDWTIFAEDIVSKETENKLEKSIDVNEVAKLIENYYDQLNGTNLYVVFSNEVTIARDGSYIFCLRYQGGTEANILVGLVTVNPENWNVTDESGNSWNLYE